MDITPPPRVLHAVEASMCTAGAAFILRGSTPADARVLNPHTMTVEADASGIRGFSQRVDQRVQRFAAEEIIYIHLWHPTSDVHGLAPMAVAGLDISTAVAVAQFTAQFFAEGALPPIIIQPSEGATVSETDAAAMREAWRATAQGVRNMWRALFTRRRLEVQTLEVPHLDRLAMSDVDEIVLRRIATAFGVPVTMITDAANYATAREHRLSFWRDTVIPQVRLVADAWANAYGVNIYPDYDSIDALVEQESDKRASMVQLVQAGVVTPQEARVYLGFDTPAMDEERTSVLSWAEELLKWKRKSESRGVKCADFESSILPESLILTVESLADAGRDPFAWTRYLPVGAKARGKEPPFGADEEALVSAILRVLTAQGRDIMQISDEEIAAALAEALRPVIGDQVVDAAIANMTATAGYADIERIADFASLWAAQHTYDLVAGITRTTRQALQRLLPRAMAEGWNNEQIAAAIRPYFGEARARTIAITEITRAYSRGVEIAQEVLSQDGVRTTQVWRTAADEMVCPICAPRNGKRRGKGWDAPPPAHPNCRCWITLEVAR